MAEQFYTILTKIGKAKIANANALGNKLNLTKFQVGDGSGTYYNPTEDQLILKNKVWEGNINSVTVDKENFNWIVIETVIPSDIGGFMIREAAVLDSDNNIIAIGKYPETYKPVVAEGSAKDLYIKMILEVSNSSSVTLKIDPTVILATKKDIEILSNKISNLKAADIKTNNGISVEDNIKQLKENSTKIILDKIEPQDVEDNTFWLQDVGENYSIPNGEGILIANASFDGDKDIKFEEVGRS